jgi:hypothetical protein
MNNQTIEPIPCYHCRGTGREITVLEIWEGIAGTLQNLRWSQDQIAHAREQVKPNEILWGMPGIKGFDVVTPGGAVRTITRLGF